MSIDLLNLRTQLVGLFKLSKICARIDEIESLLCTTGDKMGSIKRRVSEHPCNLKVLLLQVFQTEVTVWDW